jgi:hypothetical protein
MKTSIKLVLFAVALMLGFAACDDDDGSPSPPDAPPADMGPPPLEQ